MRKDRRKSTNAVTFQGTRSRKYRSFNSVTQIKVSSEMTDIKSTEDPDMSTAKGSDALDNGHRSNLDGEQEPKQRITTEEDVLSAPESAKDHNTTEGDVSSKRMFIEAKTDTCVVSLVAAEIACKGVYTSFSRFAL